MKQFLLGFLLIFSGYILGQGREFGHDVKIYGNMAFMPESDWGKKDTIYTGYEIPFRLHHPVSLGLCLNADKKNTHEFLLSRLYFHSDNESPILLKQADSVINLGKQNRREWIVSVRYDYFRRIYSVKKICLQLGFSAHPYLFQSDFSPVNNSNFGGSAATISTRFSVVPRIQLSLGKRWVADGNFAFNFLTWGYTMIRTENPSLPLDLRRTYFQNIHSPLSGYAALGLGLRI
ncbi:MAG: hypothetical protein K1X92_07245 [Bacteroidia bacterium]|nr:hypothetical protein [Bacteroidia bacterium]